MMVQDNNKIKNLHRDKKSTFSHKKLVDNQTVLEETLEMRMDSCVKTHKEIHELIVGYTPYTLNFLINSYSGITNKPSKLNAFTNAIIGIILVDGQCSFSLIGSIMGLNVDIDIAERKMLENAINQMIENRLIEGDQSSYKVTEEGKTFAEHGEMMEPYQSQFSLWYIPSHKEYVELRNEINEDYITESDLPKDGFSTELSLEEIKKLADVQASHAHSLKDRYILQSASYLETKVLSYNLYACFIRSVKTKEIRVLIYDDNNQKILDSFSTTIDSDYEIKKSLYEAMLGYTPNVEIIEDKDAIISEEQKEAETKLLNDSYEENQITETEEPLYKKLNKRALYDSISFETELHTIFQVDNPDEIWLSSPWVGDDAFIRSRVPLIKEFLKQGGLVFISYSEAEAGLDLHKKMVGWESNKAIQSLAKEYPGQFFYAEFEAFHSKNVIEVKDKQCILFTGSFNVLSFHVIPTEMAYIRKEEMALVTHYQSAESKYKRYKEKFACSYIERANNSLSHLSEHALLNYRNKALDYFRKDPSLAAKFADFDEKLNEICFSIRNKNFEKKKKGEKDESQSNTSNYEKKGSTNDYYKRVFATARKHIEADLIDDHAIFLKLASLCYASIGTNSQNMNLEISWNQDIIGFLSRSDVQEIVQYNLVKGREEGTTTILVQTKGYTFKFFNLTLENKEYQSLIRKRSFLKLKETIELLPRDLVKLILEEQE